MGPPDVSTRGYQFNQLDKKNWKTFSWKAQNKFEDEDQWQYIIGPPVTEMLIVQRPALASAMGTVDTKIVNPDYADWKKGNDKTMRRIAEMVQDDQVQYIEHATTAQEMWNNLRDVYEAVGMQSMIATQDKLSTIKYAGIESGPLQDHLDIILGYANDLRRGKDGLTDYKLLQLTLKSLPPEFTSLIQSISLSGHTSLGGVTQVLLEEETRQRVALESNRREEHARTQGTHRETGPDKSPRRRDCSQCSQGVHCKPA
jgi:hypothetical protein